MRVVVPFPDHPYYLWQVLVQAEQFRLSGFRPQVTYLAYLPRTRESEGLKQFRQESGFDVLVWRDWRPSRDLVYNPAMKPGLIGRWLTEGAEQDRGDLLILDPDALPLHPASPRPFKRARRDRWRGTDTDAYTGPAYLKTKNCWELLCEICHVDPDEAARFPGIGAQYLVTAEAGSGTFWTEVAELSVEAYRALLRSTPPEGETPVQAWCAEMYVAQLLMIREGRNPSPDPAMRMVWASDHADLLPGAGFFHNAGVVEAGTGHWWKGAYQTVPPWEHSLVQEVDPGSASTYFLQILDEAGPWSILRPS